MRPPAPRTRPAASSASATPPRRSIRIPITKTWSMSPPVRASWPAAISPCRRSRSIRPTAGTGSSDVEVNTPLNVKLDDHAVVTGYEGVDSVTKYSGVHTEANSFGRATGLFGYVDASSTNNTTLVSDVHGANGGAGGAIVT